MELRDDVNLDIDSILRKLQYAEAHYRGLERLVFKKVITEPLIKLKRDNTAESFVRKFFDKFNKEYRTQFYESNNTYCAVDTRRSIGDLYRLSFSYFGDRLSMVDIICETYKRVLAGNLTANYCYQINKRVYKNRPAKNGNYFDSSMKDELGLTKQHYDLLLSHYNNK